MTSKGKKIVADSFSSSQPGYISVAGETFFLNLPDEQADILQSRLMDESLKGDLSFQTLFLGGEPKETNPKGQFTKAEQTLVRRIFRTIFGVNAIPTKKGISLPCKQDEVDLLLRALEIRRKVLIGQIEAYDTLSSPDIHARYMREHLLRLNKLIGEEIPTTIAPCKNTDILDPNAPPRLPLDDKRMLRLLEIFAFLLAQGKDPLDSLVKSLPQPTDILPRMAIKNAPGLKDYEDAYALANPGNTPTYTDTLSKIKQILTGQITVASGAENQELLDAFEDIEDALGITNPTGSYTDRADVLIKRIEQMENEKKQDLADLSKVKTSLASIAVKEAFCQKDLAKAKADLAAAPTAQEKADLEKKVTDLEAEKQALEAEKQALTLQFNNATAEIAAKQLDIDRITKERDDCQAKLATSISEKERDALQQQITDLENQKKALEATIAGSGNPNQALLDANTRIAELETEIQKIQSELNARPTLLEKQALEQQIAQLTTEKQALEADIVTKDTEINTLRQDITNRDTQITQLQTDLAARPTLQEKQALENQITQLTNEKQALQADIVTKNTEINTLRQDITNRDTQISQLQTDLAARPTLQEKQALDQQIAQLTSEKQALENQVTQLTTEKQALEATILTKDTEITNRDTQITQLQADLAARPTLQQRQALEQQITQLTNEKQALENQVTQLTNEKQALEATIVTKNKEITNRDTQITQLQTDLATRPTLQDKQDLENQLNQLQAEKQALEAERAILQSLYSVVPNLTPQQLQDLVNSQTLVQQLQQQISTLQTQLAACPDPNQITTLNSQIQTLQNQLTAANQNVATLTGQLNQRPTQEQLNQVTQERDDARRERDALRNELAQANAKVDAGRIYKFLFTKLNEFLARKGLQQLPESPTEDTVTSRISDLEQRMNIPPPPPTNTMSICLLNLLYTLIRRILSKHGLPWSDNGAAKNNELWKKVFNAIKNKAVAEPIPEGIIRLFFIILTNLLNKGEPTGDGYSIVSQQSQQIFTEVYNKAKTLLENNPLFMNEYKECAAELLNEFFPTKYNFKMIYVLPTGRLQKKLGMEDLGIVNLGSVFLLILTMTQQVLNNNEQIIAQARCSIPEASMLQVQSVAPEPGPAPGPGPAPEPEPIINPIQPTFDLKKKCEETIFVKPANPGASVNNSINLITGQAAILQMYPFCLDVSAWSTTRYDKQDLFTKIKNQIIKVAGDPSSPGFQQRIQSINDKFNLRQFGIRINVQSADVQIGGRNKTRKHKHHKLSKKSKTYKRSK